MHVRVGRDTRRRSRRASGRATPAGRRTPAPAGARPIPPWGLRADRRAAPGCCVTPTEAYQPITCRSSRDRVPDGRQMRDRQQRRLRGDAAGDPDRAIAMRPARAVGDRDERRPQLLEPAHRAPQHLLLRVVARWQELHGELRAGRGEAVAHGHHGSELIGGGHTVRVSRSSACTDVLAAELAGRRRGGGRRRPRLGRLVDHLVRFVLDGGKRLRPEFLLCGWRAVPGVRKTAALPDAAPDLPRPRALGGRRARAAARLRAAARRRHRPVRHPPRRPVDAPGGGQGARRLRPRRRRRAFRRLDRRPARRSRAGLGGRSVRRGRRRAGRRRAGAAGVASDAH